MKIIVYRTLQKSVLAGSYLYLGGGNVGVCGNDEGGGNGGGGGGGTSLSKLMECEGECIMHESTSPKIGRTQTWYPSVAVHLTGILVVLYDTYMHVITHTWEVENEH